MIPVVTKRVTDLKNFELNKLAITLNSIFPLNLFILVRNVSMVPNFVTLSNFKLYEFSWIKENHVVISTF